MATSSGTASVNVGDTLPNRTAPHQRPSLLFTHRASCASFQRWPLARASTNRSAASICFKKTLQNDETPKSKV